MKPSEISKLYYKVTWKQIKEAPKIFLWRLWRKTELMANNFEISDNINYYFFQDRYSWVLRLPTPGWGFIGALAIWGGLVLIARKGKGGGNIETGGGVVLLLAIVYSATLVAFYIFARYRLPVLSAFAPLAAFGLKTIWEFMARRQRGYLIGALAVVIGLNAWTHRTIMTPQFDMAHYQTGNCLLQLGKYEEAEKEFREAIGLKPLVPAYHINLAGTLVQLGKNREAMEEYNDALGIEPRNPHAHIGLGNIYLAQKMYEEAAMHYQIGLLFGEDSSSVWTLLGKAYMNMGRTLDAADSFKKALDLDPKNAEAKKLLEQIGQP
jgi:tetratricopeptide (TPR) repeat protein